MLRHLALALLVAGCASAAPAEPRVAERIVYVQAPCPAPVIVERQGRAEPPAHPVRHPKARPSFGKWMKHAHAKPKKPATDKKAAKRARRCSELSTPEMRESCRQKTARR